jgi:signal peptidase II
VSSAPKRSPADKGPAKDSADALAGGSAAIDTAPLPISRYVAFFAIAIVGCGADLVTKQAMFGWLGLPVDYVDQTDPANVALWQGDPELPNPHRWWLITGRLGIETSINRGALFGMGEGYWWIFAVLSVIAATAILTWLFYFKAARDRWLTVALGSITGGILGNLYDRLGLWDSTGLQADYQHGVRDWILFVWPEIKLQMFNPWPNFNIADSLLVTGAIMLVIHAIVWREKPAKSNEAKSPARKTTAKA